LENKEIGNNLNIILDLLGYTQRSFAIKTGTTQSYISNMINGNRPLSKKTLHYLSVHHSEVNLKWLLDGEGYMFRDGYVKVQEPAPTYKQKVPPLFEAAQSRIEMYELRVADLEQRVAELENLLKKDLP
jgi:transcriptional regulator with XRE-family HTH domain